MVPRGPQRRMKMGSRWRSVCAAALATEVDLLWRSESPLTSMAGTLGSTTNCSLQKLWRARVGDFRFFRSVQRRAVERSRAMEVVYPCCCGLDVHKKSITACVLWAEARGKSRKEKKRFATFTHDLLQLADWPTNRVQESWSAANRLAYAPSHARHVVAFARNSFESCTGSAWAFAYGDNFGDLHTRQRECAKRRCEPARRAIVPKCSQVGELWKYRAEGKSASSVS